MELRHESQTSITKSISGAVTRLTLRGRFVLDGQNSLGDLREAIEGCLSDPDPECRVIVVGLAGVTRLDASALTALADGYNRARAAGRRLRAERPPPIILAMLRACHDTLLLGGGADSDDPICAVTETRSEARDKSSLTSNP